MRKVPIVLLLVLCCALPLAGEVPTVAVSDFAVNSDNASFKFLGKGFAEIVAFELGKSSDLRLVDRAKRNALLAEMEFSLSGAVDEGSQVRIGKLLSVRYLISGSITDMGGLLLVSLTMVDVETGQVVWNDQLAESGGKYAYIGAYFGTSLLKYFKATVAKSTKETLVAKTEQNESSVVALSQGIAALDAGKKDEAKAKLAEATKIDPGNAVAKAFLSRLASTSATFKVVPERYVSYYNPAYLATLEKDRAFVNYTQAWVTYGTNTKNKGLMVYSPDKAYRVSEPSGILYCGYAYPFDGWGLSAEILAFEVYDAAQDSVSGWMDSGDDKYYIVSGILGAGFSVFPWLDLGFEGQGAYKHREGGFMVNSQTTGPAANTISDTFEFGGAIAMVLKSPGNDLTYDLVAGKNTETLYYLTWDGPNSSFHPYHAPLYVEQTLTLALNEKKTFLALKQVNDIYLDRSLYYGRAMPCVEHWFGDLFAFRAGVEGTMYALDGSSSFGLGGTAGLTLRLSGFDLDVNYTFRMRPSRMIADTVIPESVIFFTLTKDGILKH